MERQYTIAIIWLSGFLLGYWMLKAEHEADPDFNGYTNGDKTFQVLLSILSFVIVMIMLVKAWAISVNGYWNKPVAKKEKPVKAK